MWHVIHVQYAAYKLWVSLTFKVMFCLLFVLNLNGLNEFDYCCCKPRIC